MMKTSENGVLKIKQREGLRLDAYPDPASGGDPWTIGHGSTHGVTPGMKITAELADQMLRDDLVRFEGVANRILTVPVTQAQFDAIVSLAYNIGPAAIANSTVVRCLNAGNTMDAADAFLLWKKAAGKINPGLLRRRKAERSQFLGEA